MLIVELYNGQFRIQSDDDQCDDTRFESMDYIFTEDINAFMIYEQIDVPTILSYQFKNVKINTFVTSIVRCAYDFIQLYHENIKSACINHTISNLDDFILINSLSSCFLENINLSITVGNIAGLTDEHFVNDLIRYNNTKLSESNKIVCENAKNMISVFDFPLETIDLQKCKYDRLQFGPPEYIYYETAKHVLSNVSVKTLETDVHIIDILVNTKIPNIILGSVHRFYLSEEIQEVPSLDIDPLLKNPNIESLTILGRNVTYTKSVLEENETIKKLAITGPECDQELISEVCKSNKYRVRYMKTKSARSERSETALHTVGG